MKKNKTKSWNVLRVLFAILAVCGFGYLMANGNDVPDAGALTGSLDPSGLINPYSIVPSMATGAAIMTPEAMQKLLTDIETAQKNYNDAVEKKADKSVIDSMNAELAKFKELDIESLKNLVTTVKAQGEELTILKKQGGKGGSSFKTINEAIAHAIMEQKDEFAKIVSAGGMQEKSLQISLKAVVDMGELNTIGAGSTAVLLTQNTGIISTIRSRELRYQAHVSVGTIGNERALWVEETTPEGTPIFIGEGDAKTQLSVLYVEKTESVKKIAVYGKVTTEMMADLPQLISYIQNNLMKRLDLKVEDALFNATGAADDPKGIISYATAFSAGSLASQIDDANELDVLEAIALQVEVADGIPNVLFIHPSTMAKIKLIKDLNGRPVWKDYVTTNGMMNVSGMDIVTTKGVTAGNFVGGDTSVVNLLIREALNIKIGLDGNDFTTNKKTMLLEKRLVQFVSANDTQVLVKGDFATAKAALETP